MTLELGGKKFTISQGEEINVLESWKERYNLSHLDFPETDSVGCLQMIDIDKFCMTEDEKARFKVARNEVVELFMSEIIPIRYIFTSSNNAF
jgi:hypothetical protein